MTNDDLSKAIHALWVAASLAAPLVDPKWLERADLDRALAAPALVPFRSWTSVATVTA